MNKYPSPIIMTVFAFGCITIGILFVPVCEYLDRVFSPSGTGASVEAAPVPFDCESPPQSVPVPVSTAGPGHITFEDLLDTIEWVESKGLANAYGDFIREYQAAGSFQLWKIYVDDVNRIAGTEYTYYDRLNRSCSREMARIYLNHYGGTFEEMARKHNGGPNGHNKESTKPYWEKVKARLEISHDPGRKNQTSR